VRADDPSGLASALEAWAGGAGTRDYLAVQAYLAPFADVTVELRRVREALLQRYHRATTLGYGPRFLHSTGQLHKGGPAEGRFLQLTDELGTDVPVPGTSYSFGRLIAAQALGDLEALVRRGRNVLRVELGRDVARGLERLVECLHG